MTELIASDRPFIIVGDSYPPYSYLEDGEYKGTDVDIIKAAFNKLDIKPVFRFRPWARAMAEVRSGESDAIYSLFKTSEREEFLDYPSIPLNYEKNILVVNGESDKTAKSIEDIKGWRIGVVTENSYGKAFDDYKDIERIEAKSNDLLVLQLNVKNRFDAIIINDLVFDMIVNNYVAAGKIKNPDFRKLEYVPNNAPLYIGFSKMSHSKHELIAKEFSEALKLLKKEGLVNKILSQYRDRTGLKETPVFE
ncbi:ABC transporter substrate-binding protein [uncultured Cocleimonas sp.]|uniref:substrate-binding periplasmic protein n=1 Tax=uncultured Cocleimonas sp. TaxID=1051587 RepID=UPI0026093749|nr:transporter substrate-binding domain-containing protein [uncultured Cocleimonas sp.]